MSEIGKRVIKRFNINKATEDQLNDLSRYELIDIILFFKKEINRYKQAIEEIREIANENKNTVQYGGICRSILKIMQKCEGLKK